MIHMISKYITNNANVIYIDSDINNRSNSSKYICFTSFPSEIDIIKKLSSNQNTIIVMVNGYEGKSNILTYIIRYYNTININDEIIVVVSKKKGASSIERILADMFEYYKKMKFEDYSIL